MSYPIFEFFGWILFYLVGYVFMSYYWMRHFGSYLQKKDFNDQVSESSHKSYLSFSI